MNKTTSNEELSAGPYKKLNVHKRFFFFPFKSTILLQFISNATIYSTPKMVISIINTESQFLKLIFLSYKSSTLCVWVFFFSESGSAYFSPWNWLQQKSYPLNPQKAKAVHIVFLEYFLPVFKLTKNLFWNKKKTEKIIYYKTMILKTEQSVSDWPENKKTLHFFFSFSKPLVSEC